MNRQPITFLLLLGLLLTGLQMKAQMSFTLSNEMGNPGDTVDISFSVDQFTSIAGYQGTISWDSSKLDFISLSSPTVGINNIFGSPGQGLIPLDKATFTWVDFSGVGQTLPNGSTVMQAKFEIKALAAAGLTPVTLDSSVTILAYSDGTVLLAPGVTQGSVQIGPANLTFTAGNEMGFPGDTVDIPISVDLFNGISGYQGTISWDSSKLDFISLSSPTVGINNIFGNPGQGIIPLDKATFTWVDFSGGSVTLPNGSTVIQAKFEIRSSATPGLTPVTVDGSVTSLAYTQGGGLISPNTNQGSVDIQGCTPTANPSFTVSDTVCVNLSHPIPFVTGDLGGTFAVDQGATVNPTTGELDLSTTVAGTTYTLTYTVGMMPCPATSSQTVFVQVVDDPSFLYPDTICIDAMDPVATITGTLGGIFTTNNSSTIDPTTGTLDMNTVSLDTSGITLIDIIYQTQGMCSAQSSVTISVVGAQDASFLYPDTLCPGAANPLATLTGTPGGTFSVDQGASINTTTGELDMTTVQANTAYTITYMLADFCQSSSQAVLLIADQTAPDTVALATLMEDCSVTVPVPTTMDNCAGMISGTTADSLNYDQQGTYTVNWTFDDGNGNQVVQTQTVIVQDNTPPTVICRDLSLILDSTGILVLDPAMVDSASFDACGIQSLQLSQDTFTTADIGTQTVMLMVEDVNGNRDSCSANLTIMGTTNLEGELAAQVSLTAFPNPVANQLHLQWQSPWRGAGTVAVLTLQGQVVLQQNWHKQQTEMELELSLGSLPAGSYLVQLSQEGYAEYVRVVKQ